MIPSPSPNLLEIIRYAWSRDCSTQELSRRVQEEEALSSTLLQFVGKKHNNLGQEITTASRATLLLGSKAVGSIAAWVAVAHAINEADVDPVAVEMLYEDALRRSAALMILARKNEAIPEEHAAAIGMFLELGRVELICQDTTRVIWMDGLRASTGESRLYKEREHLGATHLEAFKAIARRWSLPEEITEPVLNHHEDNASVAANMARCADVMAEVYTAAEPAEALATAKVILHERLGIDPEKVYGMVAALADRVEEAGWLLGIPPRDQPELSEILSQHDDNYEEMSREQLLKLIENHKRESKEAQLKIEELKGRLVDLKSKDPLTGLYNRQAYFARLRREVEGARGRQGSLSLLVVDIDMLEEQNDCHGVDMGDAILQRVGELMAQACEERDIAARVGGDEFALVLWNRNAPKARLAAERLRAAIESAKVDHEGSRARLSASIVGITLEDLKQPDADLMHRRAMESLERIKGSNRTAWAA
ncbi:MAG: diguanylate cyclase [Myxococcota bacterium]|nr:diguanylate cyclase [Myxococcota bacterium]